MKAFPTQDVPNELIFFISFKPQINSFFPAVFILDNGIIFDPSTKSTKMIVLINYSIFFLSCHIWTVITFHKNISELSQNSSLISNKSSLPIMNCLIVSYLGDFTFNY